MSVMEEENPVILPASPQIQEKRMVLRPPAHPNRNSTIAVEDPDSKKQNCLCAPTTHAGSFRCRLHRHPAPSMDSLLHVEKKRAVNSQKHFSPKVKLALPHRLRRGSNKSTIPSCSSTTASSSLPQQLQQDDHQPGLSRLSRTSTTNRQHNQPMQMEEEQEAAFTAKPDTQRHSDTESGSEPPHSEIVVSNLHTDKKRHRLRPLFKLPSI